ncbi:MAG: aminoacyl-tRNA hydrolase [Clostridia bacterium]|nr:aminoacyl-tRNA hydrolase [Clostridia bacterium]
MADIFELFKQISKDNSGAAGAPTHMIVGLGNPGKDYAETRHNAGFLAMDKICASLGCECQRVKFKAFTNTVKIGDKSVLLMMPQTYMNLSGEAVGEAASYYNIPAENIIVLVDDIYLEPGYMRIRKKGSAGGHNGLKNIIEHLGSDNFPRIKLGVGAKPKEADLAAWVTGRLSRAAYDLMTPCLDACLDASKLIMNGKADEAMGKYNGMKPEVKEEN